MKAVKELGESWEAERIKTLKKYEILDTPPDNGFDHLTKMAAQLLDVPIAIISLVDSNRIWFKSKFGIESQEMEKDLGLCSTAIQTDELFTVEDALLDSRTNSNPLVTGKFGLRFYAAVPIRTKEGFNLGTLCVIDKKPRHFSAHQESILQNLADLVIYNLEMRMEARTAIKHHNHVLNITAHDLKNPLSIMPLLADMIIRNKDNPRAIDDIAQQIKSAGKRMNKILDDLLEAARNDTGRLQLRLKKVNFSVLLKSVVATNSSLARNKGQLLKLDIEENCVVYGDAPRITEIADNLINNAIKYSPYQKNIYISLKTRGKKAVLEVRDEGPGLTKDDLRNLFRKYTSLSAQPTGGENSSGLGLSIVKHLVDAHRGKIIVRSAGENKGASFVVELPISE